MKRKREEKEGEISGITFNGVVFVASLASPKVRATQIMIIFITLLLAGVLFAHFTGAQ